jgi:hypothetical protein
MVRQGELRLEILWSVKWELWAVRIPWFKEFTFKVMSHGK